MSCPLKSVSRSFFTIFVILAATAPLVRAADEVFTLDPVVTSVTREAFAADMSLAGPITDSRGWTRLDRTELEAFGVRSVEDLTWFVPGASTAPPYGIAGVPILRGDQGEIFQNGQRRGFNRNMYPPSLNGVEHIEAMTGAPPASYGFATGTGGLVNFITKRPVPGRDQTTLGAVRGSWDEWRWTVDTTRSLGEHLAARLTVERVDADSFYRLVENRSWQAALAMAWVPRTDLRWDLHLEYFDASFYENPGTNRPTQALIDRGEYITGTSVPVQGGSGGSYFGNTFTPTGTVRLDGSQVLVAPDDGATARIFSLQLIGNLVTHDTLRAVSRTYFEHGRAEKHSAYAFYSGVPRSHTLEQRFELDGALRRGAVQHDWLAGVALRGEERLSYVDFFNEAMNAFDLTLDPATFRLPTNQFFAVRPVPGRPYFAIPGARYPRPGGGTTTGISQTLHSKLVAGSVFLQDRLRWDSGWSLLLGARIDAVHVRTEDPLPPPGYTPISDKLGQVLPLSFSASLHRPLTEKLAAYVTLNRAAAVESSSSSGGFGLTNNALPEEVFENRSDLVEAGLKYAGRDQRLHASVAVYHQQRVRTNPRFGLPDEILVRGVEAAAGVQPADWLKLNGNFAYMAANYIDGPLPGSVATVPQFDPARPSDTFGSYPAGDYRIPGLPRWQGNLMAQVLLPSGWNLRAWGSMQGEQNLDLFGLVIIPRQFTLNLGLTYRRAGWELALDCLNCTDEFNWRATGSPFAGGDLVTRELPRHWRVSVKRTF
ncbi:MAG: TonB-dependent receptor [Opitutaceae bacterium]|nr:TonB-dependent receptor [Opitutaceae bacterium]